MRAHPPDVITEQLETRRLLARGHDDGIEDVVPRQGGGRTAELVPACDVRKPVAAVERGLLEPRLAVNAAIPACNLVLRHRQRAVA